MKRSIFIVFAVALLASCSNKEIDFQTPVQDDVVFHASFEQPSDIDTKVYANEDLLLRWTAEDRVSIFNKLTYNQEYKFTGQTGDNAGGFKKVDNDEFVTGNPISHVVSVYPYQASTKITEEEVLTITLPAEQHYAENTFGLGANTMVSVSEDNVLQYKNVGGYLMLKLYGEGVSVSSITLKGNNGEKLAGKATVTMPLDDTPFVSVADDSHTDITLVCDTPVSLGATAEESIEFWFVVPPVAFSKGFTISINQIGGVIEKTTSKSIAIERNKLSKMAPMDIVPIPETVDLGLPSGLKWASFNLGASMPEEYGEYYAWGETQTKSNYSWSTYKWYYDGDYNKWTKYCPADKASSWYGEGTPDGKTVLDLEDDAARANLGEAWRMPTKEEWIELRENCTWTWTTQTRVKGYLVTSSNGNSIFLPAAGRLNNTSLGSVGYSGLYWSSSLDTVYPYSAEFLEFFSGDVSMRSYYRSAGFSVRPVYAE